jgi:hypothetical protein
MRGHDGTVRWFSELNCRPATSSTPATGHDGGTATSNEPAAATTSDSNYKTTEHGQDCHRQDRLPRRKPRCRRPGRTQDNGGYAHSPTRAPPLTYTYTVTGRPVGGLVVRDDKPPGER